MNLSASRSHSVKLNNSASQLKGPFELLPCPIPLCYEVSAM